jgi:F0F1-type ATP synthase epsilon subunit
MEPKIHVVIKNKETVFFEGDATALSSFNDIGLFDVLPMHENFISLIRDKVILHLNEKEQKEFKIRNGILKVKNNNVNIYLGL